MSAALVLGDMDAPQGEEWDNFLRWLAQTAEESWPPAPGPDEQQQRRSRPEAAASSAAARRATGGAAASGGGGVSGAEGGAGGTVRTRAGKKRLRAAAADDDMVRESQHPASLVYFFATTPAVSSVAPLLPILASRPPTPHAVCCRGWFSCYSSVSGRPATHALPTTPPPAPLFVGCAG